MSAAEPTQPALGPAGWLRWGWRQLTSMRTALVLLMLLAVAAIPGSIWPQRSVDPVRVSQYLDERPELGPWLDRLGLFEVYTSPWFAAIYLLLMVSLVGCILPRTRQHWQALRSRPPAAPRRLTRLPAHASAEVAADREAVLRAARTVLRRHRYRVRPADGSAPGDVAAEGGYLRETGNLLFHVSLLGVVVSMGVGHLWGWRGEVILPEGQTFTSSVARYDTLQPGPWVDPDSLQPFVLTLDAMTVTFESGTDDPAQFGAPREFSAEVTTRQTPDAPAQRQRLAVNAPLSFGGVSVFLLGNGYAPVVTVRDGEGRVLYSGATPFLPQDDLYTSTGAVKVVSAEPDLGFHGAFLPTVVIDERGPTSRFPALVDPALALGVYEGELYPEGRPQSVYTLDVSAMEQVTGDDGAVRPVLLRPGESAELPGGRGTVTLDSVVRWSGLVMRHDPGRLPALISAGLLLAGLVAMLTVRRRRVFVRVHDPADGRPGHTGVTVAGLAKGTDPGLAAEVELLLEEIGEAVGSGAATRKDEV